MQSLWSQVGRIGCRCRCPTCLSNKHTLVRRVSTTIGRIRANPNGSVTFLYSEIFSGATVADGKSKRQRRAHWNAAITRAREELKERRQALNDDEWDTVQPRSNQALKMSADGQRPEDIQNHDGEDHSNGPHSDGEPIVLERFPVEAVMQYEIKPGGTRPLWSQIGDKPPTYLPPQSLWSGDLRRRTAAERRWSEKKLAIMELSIAKLVARLLMVVDVDSQPPSNLIVIPDGVRQFAKLSRAEQRTLINDLEYEQALAKETKAWERRPAPNLNVKLPHYSQVVDGSHVENVRELNYSLLALLKAYKSRQLNFKALIIKACHNLLVCPAPPDVQTMNILLLGFHHLDKVNPLRHQVVGYVASVCKEAHVRPNELTCATILASFRKRGLADRFAEFIMLMRGHDQGLMLAKPDVHITEASQGRLIPQAGNPSKINQAVNPSALVFWEVIKGVLKFSGLEQAIDICKNFNRHAWGYDWICLYELLLESLREKDWASGLWVWDQVESFTAKSYQEPSRITATMLALCMTCGEREKFEEVLNSAVNRRTEVNTPELLIDLAARSLRRVGGTVDEE